MIVLDTTVLVYAVGTDHPLREPSRRILRALADHVQGATTVEVIQEFTHVRARRRGRMNAVRLARDYAVALQILPVSSADLELGLSLYTAHDELGAFDAILAATTLHHHARALISADRAFGTVADLHWVDPSSPDIDRILS